MRPPPGRPRGSRTGTAAAGDDDSSVLSLLEQDVEVVHEIIRGMPEGHERAELSVAVDKINIGRMRNDIAVAKRVLGGNDSVQFAHGREFCGCARAADKTRVKGRTILVHLLV